MDRYYENVFIGREDSVIPDPADDFRMVIQQNALRLLHDLEEKLSNEDRTKTKRRCDISVYTGCMGTAYLYWHLHSLGLAKSNQYIDKSFNLIEANYKHITDDCVSFMEGDAGILALGVVVSRQIGKLDWQNKSLDRLLKLGRLVFDDSDPSAANEILYGRAGYLHALLFVNLFQPGVIQSSFLAKVVTKLIDEGKQPKYPYLYYEWHKKCYLGAAHGISGILYTLLKARSYMDSKQLELVKKTLDWLLTLKFPSGNFPSSVGSENDRLIHFCHGAPGTIYTFLEAHNVFQNDSYLTAAEGFATEIWRRGILRKGYSLCHGVSGNAYALMAIYQHTKNEKYMKQSFIFARWCFDYGKKCSHSPDRPLSLFEGLAGAVYMLSDFGWNTMPKFPCFQL